MVLFLTPKTLRWVVLCGCTIWGLMQGYRLLLIGLFRDSLSIESANSFEPLPAILLGARYDARLVALVCLVSLLVSWIPRMHPFRDEGGKNAAKIWLMVAGSLFILFYLADFLHFTKSGQRLDGLNIVSIFNGNTKVSSIFKGMPVMLLLLGVLLLMFLWWLSLSGLYSLSGNLKGVSEPPIRSFWHILFVVIFLLLIHGSVSLKSLANSDLQMLHSAFGQEIALNPFQAFVRNLSDMK